MFEVTFYSFSTVLNRAFFNIEVHRSMADAFLRASALNWVIHSVRQIEAPTV
jgi:hypothetical protein